jgi:mannosyltransferase OCH1-like enzyme
MSIEKNIWQTYETNFDALPDYAKESVGTWTYQNPEWTHGYMSGQDREDFFKEHFDTKTYETYVNLPLGVMKAGLWRFAILYIHGGIYTDMDTHCKAPVDTWLNSEYDMILDIERDTPWLATQTIASKAGHPLLKAAIDLCVERCSDGIIQHNHMVHYYTDVQMFTDALYKKLGVEPYAKHINEWAPELMEMAFLKENKVKILHGEEARRLLDKDVVHLYWGDDREAGWIAWKKDPRVNESYPNGFNPHEWEKE